MLEKRNLTIFKELVQAANMDDEFDSLTNVTFLIPSDKSFADNKWKTELELNPNRLKNNPELKEFLRNHITEPLIKTCDLTEQKVKSLSGNDIRVNLYTTHPIFTNIMNRATINCARLIHFDDESCGSVLHQVDRIITPPTNTLREQLESNENYSMFLRFVKEANLTELFDDLEQDLTVLVPKNDVFREVKDWYNDMLENKDELTKVIKAHIIPGETFLLS